MVSQLSSMGKKAHRYIDLTMSWRWFVVSQLSSMGKKAHRYIGRQCLGIVWHVWRYNRLRWAGKPIATLD